MKKKYLLVSLLVFLLTICNAQKVKLNEPISNYSDDFSLKGISTETNKYTYEYNKKFNKLLLDHEVDVMWVITKNNIIIAYIYLLIPNNSRNISDYELELIVKKVEKELNITFKENNGSYGIANDEVVMEFSKGNNPESGSERILFYTALTKEL